MEVKPGYKQTEVGVIPEDWAVQALGDAVEFLDGRRRPVKDSDRAKMRGDIPYYGASGIVDYVNDFLFDEELILLGEDGENILSRNCRLAFKISGKTWVNNHAHVLRPRSGVVLDYLVEFLESRNYAQYNTGTAQPKLNKLVCSQIPVVCPPPPEQRAIAAALSDVDALLGGLDRLIAKKRDLKQAAMQQLLTGQTRLPGFSGAWEVKRFGSLVEHVFKKSPLSSGDGLEQGAYPLLVSGGEPKRIEVAQFRDLETLVFSDGGVFAVRCAAGSFSVTDHCYVLRLNPATADMRWFEAWFSLHSQQMDRLTFKGSGLRNLDKPSLRNIEISSPERVEQSAIAAVLSDMDAELAALEARRDKTRDLKQAMMQELLTGRTRVV